MTLLARVRTFADNLLNRPARYLSGRVIRQVMKTPDWHLFEELTTERRQTQRLSTTANAILRAGERFFSQDDSDGIINAILERLRLDSGVFVEYGCGDGLENNSLQLLMRGWSGVWIGATSLKVTIPASSRRLSFEQEWVTRENCVAIMRRGLDAIGARAPNLISMDLDGNDWHFVRRLLGHGFAPDVFVVEYNGKFPPPIRFSIEYDASHTWRRSDYFGASLQSFVDLFDSSGYRLVCCNITGTNAFFVPAQHMALFADVPSRIEDLFMASEYGCSRARGHATDPRTVERFLREA
jgi:hypothetical protein